MADHPEDKGGEVGVEQGDEAAADAVIVEVWDVAGLEAEEIGALSCRGPPPEEAE